jgi:CubicO group peptidase (beta-lactamase class C family)
LSQKLASGGLIAKPRDLAMMGSYWLDDSYISTDTRRDFWEPVLLESGAVNEQNYGVGWRLKTWLINEQEVVNLNHGGVSKGAQCWLMILPEHDLVLALSINTRTETFQEFSALAAELLAIFLSDSE